MITVAFVGDARSLSSQAKIVIEEMAQLADEAVREYLPLAHPLTLRVEPSEHFLVSTGDTAYTMEPNLIWWGYDPQGDPVAIAAAHLRKAYFHEAYHATRFQRLRHEAGIATWTNIAIGEGLACAFARDHACAHEEWCDYDPAVIEDWARELFAQPCEGNFARWKFAHDDGRERIAFKVGVFITDQLAAKHEVTALDALWLPIEELEELEAVRRLMP